MNRIGNRFNRELDQKWTIRLQFYIRNPFKNESDQKKVHQKIELIFILQKQIPLKIIRNKRKSTLKFGLKKTI